MKDAILTKSTRKDKKLMLKIEDGPTYHFGAKGYSDFIKSKGDTVKKNAYIKRHEKNEDWSELNPGSLSRYILWNKPSLNSSVADVEKKFNIKIKNKVQ